MFILCSFHCSEDCLSVEGGPSGSVMTSSVGGSDVGHLPELKPGNFMAAATNKMLFDDPSGTANALMAAASARNTMSSLMAQAASAQFGKSEHHLGHLPAAAAFAPYHPAHYADAGAALAAVNLHAGGHVGAAGLYHSRDQATFSHA